MEIKSGIIKVVYLKKRYSIMANLCSCCGEKVPMLDVGFDRKSKHTYCKSLVISVVAFANADGVRIPIDITDKTKTI